jgi:hypothetical protein
MFSIINLLVAFLTKRGSLWISYLLCSVIFSIGGLGYYYEIGLEAWKKAGGFIADYPFHWPLVIADTVVEVGALFLFAAACRWFFIWRKRPLDNGIGAASAR